MPQNEVEANAGLFQFVRRDNTMHHRSEAHSRLEDWLLHLPAAGLRQMCTWERFCTFAREPQRRQVGGDARITVEGVAYEVDPDVAGETVVLWWGLFDHDLYIEHGDRRYGPYTPVGGPIPLHRYRRFKQTAYEKRAERIDALAAQLRIPRAAVDGPYPVALPVAAPPPTTSFVDPDPFHELTYPSALKAKQAIADALVMPLAKLPREQLDALETFLSQTLRKSDVLEYVRVSLQPLVGGGTPC